MRKDVLGGVVLELLREDLRWCAEYPAMKNKDAAAKARGGVILGVILLKRMRRLL